MNIHQRRVLFLHVTKNLAYVAVVGICTGIIIKTSNRLKRENKFTNQGEKDDEDSKAGRGLNDEDKYLEYYKQKAGITTDGSQSNIQTDADHYIEQIKNRKRGDRLTFSLWDYWFGKNE